MKLIVQIPCFNEEENLPLVVSQIPKSIDGIDIIEVLVINDGSLDSTLKVANTLGVDHVIDLKRNQGLGNAFKKGLQYALEQGADIVVNTDADNQYPGKYIPKLVKPIVLGQADIVIGDRKPTRTPLFSKRKRLLQWVGNFVVSTIVGSKVPDAVSGFRAYSKSSIYEMNITSSFSYVIDTIIQAYKKGFKVCWVGILTNPPTRPSRLFKTIFHHIRNSAGNIVRVYIMYEPLKVFTLLSIPSIVLGLIGISRFLYFSFFLDHSAGMVQSLILSAILMNIGITLVALGILGDVISKNRIMLEDLLKIQRGVESQRSINKPRP